MIDRDLQILNPLRENPRPEWFYQVPAKRGGGNSIVEYVIDSLTEKSSGPYTGLIAASATVKGCICGRGATLIDTTIEVIDHSGCIFDVAGEMTGYTGWAATNMEYLSLAEGATEGELSPCHYAAINRCCAPDSGTYA